MHIAKQMAEKTAVLLIILGILVSLIAGSLIVFAQEEDQPSAEDTAVGETVPAAAPDAAFVAQSVVAPTLKLLTDEVTLDAVVQKSLEDTIGAAAESFVSTGVIQDLADRKEAARKAAEEAARKAAAEAARKAAEEAARKEAKILAVAQRYIEESGVDISAENLLLMARTIYFEANVEPYEGKVAVANVILNRAGSPDNVRTAIYKKNAFSVVKRSDFTTKAPNASCYKAAIEALQGRQVVPKNCLWFASTSVKSCWASRNATLYCTIGSHHFYVS